MAGPDALRRRELRWAAACHYVGRRDDGIDPDHGNRSAAWVLTRLPETRPELSVGVGLDFTTEWCRWHQPSDRASP